MPKKDFSKTQQVFSQFWNADRAVVDRTDASISRNGKEALQSPTSSFSKLFKYNYSVEEKMVNIQSFINYQNDVQKLDITPASYLNIPGFYPGVATESVRTEFTN